MLVAAAPPPQPDSDDLTMTGEEPLKSHPPSAVPTAQQALMQFLDASGVSWEDFRGWLVSTGRFIQAESFATIDELPTEFCMKLGNGATSLGKCIRIYGKNPAA
jgi:hypothetical protein